MLNILIQTTALPIILGLSAYAPTGAWAANGIAPELVASFKRGDEFFAYNGERTTFDDMFTVSTTGLATMTDSDGLVKWNAHNILTYSEDLANESGGNWSTTRLTAASGQADVDGGTAAFSLTPTAVSGTHTCFKTIVNSNTVSGQATTFRFEAKANGYNWVGVALRTGQWVTFDLANGVVGTETGSATGTITSLGSGWYSCAVSVPEGALLVEQEVFNVSETNTSLSAFGGSTYTGDGTSGILVRHPHTYRNDLGGMVDNPDRTDTYVPTTASAVYLPRRNAHLYDASVAKWNAHNLFTTTDLTAWSRVGGVTTTGVSDPDGGTDAVTLTASATQDCKYSLVPNFSVGGNIYTAQAKVKYVAGSGWMQFGSLVSNGTAWFDVANGSVGTIGSTIGSATITAVTDGWYIIEIAYTSLSTLTQAIALEPTSADTTSQAISGDAISFFQPQLFRRDLNGMVDGFVATTGTAVAPTLNTAVSFPKKGLRWESTAATNLLESSNPAPITSSAITYAVGGADPNGGTEGGKLRGNGGTSTHFMGFDNTTSRTIGLTYTHSAYLRAVGSQQFVGILGGSAPEYNSAERAAVFDLINGTVTFEDANCTGFIEDVGDGWYRCTVTCVAAGTGLTNNAMFFTLTNSGTDDLPSYPAAVGDGVDVWGFDVTQESAPSSHIPTNGASENRAAETLSIAGAKTPANTSAMSISFKGLATYADENIGVSTDGGGGQFNCVFWRQSTSEYFEMLNNTGAPYTGLLGVRVEESSATDFSYDFTSELTPGVNREVSIASRYTNSTLNFAKDGVAQTAAVTAAVTDLAIYPLQLGITTSNGGAYNGFLSEVIVWGADIGDTGIAESSTP